MGKKTALNEPIILSGRVYLAGFLAQEVGGFDLPATLRPGDIKLHNVPKGGTRQRYGQDVVFTGFFAASIWNGKRFCRLLMRKKAAMDATYVGIVELRSKARTCAVDLKRLIALQAVWVAADHGYEVTYNATTHPLAHNQPVAKPAAVSNVVPDGGEKVVANTVASEEPVVASKPVSPVAADSSASSAVIGEQLGLFPDLPVSAKKVKSRRRRR